MFLFYLVIKHCTKCKLSAQNLTKYLRESLRLRNGSFFEPKKGELQMKIINKERFITALFLALLLLATVFAQLQLILLERMGG